MIIKYVFSGIQSASAHSAGPSFYVCGSVGLSVCGLKVSRNLVGGIVGLVCGPKGRRKFNDEAVSAWTNKSLKEPKEPCKDCLQSHERDAFFRI